MQYLTLPGPQKGLIAGIVLFVVSFLLISHQGLIMNIKQMVCKIFIS